MGKKILTIYVLFQTTVIVVSIILSFISGQAVHFLSRNDWWMFIVSCGILAISEALEDSK